MYNLFPWLMERLPGRQHYVFEKIDEIRAFVMKKIQEHKDTVDPSSPRDFIDCFLIRAHQVGKIFSILLFHDIESTKTNSSVSKIRHSSIEITILNTSGIGYH